MAFDFDVIQTLTNVRRRKTTAMITPPVRTTTVRSPVLVTLDTSGAELRAIAKVSRMC